MNPLWIAAAVLIAGQTALIGALVVRQKGAGQVRDSGATPPALTPPSAGPDLAMHQKLEGRVQSLEFGFERLLANVKEERERAERAAHREEKAARRREAVVGERGDGPDFDGGLEVHVPDGAGGGSGGVPSLHQQMAPPDRLEAARRALIFLPPRR